MLILCLPSVYADRDYKLPSLCTISLGCLWFGFPVHNQMWFTSPGANCSVTFKDSMYEWLPEGGCVAVNQLIKEGTYQSEKHPKITIS